MHARRLPADGGLTPVRVQIVCDPPLLTEVVSLAVSRIEGVEITRPEDRAPDVLVASTSTDWESRHSPRTILLDEASTLPALVETLTAWVSHGEGEDYTLLRSSSTEHNSGASMNRPAGKAKPLSVETPEFIRIPVLDGVNDARGTDVGGRGS